VAEVRRYRREQEIHDEYPTLSLEGIRAAAGYGPPWPGRTSSRSILRYFEVQARLFAAGHDVSTVADEGLVGQPDATVAEAAAD